MNRKSRKTDSGLTRREFIKGAALAGTGLLLGLPRLDAKASSGIKECELEYTKLISQEGDNWYPDTDGRYVAWVHDGKVQYYDINTGKYNVIENSNCGNPQGRMPRRGLWLSNGKIYWEDYGRGNPNIYGYDIEKRILKKFTDDEHRHINPKADECWDMVVWEDYSNPGTNGDVYCAFWDEKPKPVETLDSKQSEPHAYAGRFVFTDNRTLTEELFFKEDCDSPAIQLTGNWRPKGGAIIYGDKIVYEQETGRDNWDIMLYDLAKNKITQLTRSSRNEGLHHFDGRNVVFSSEACTNRCGDLDVFRIDLEKPQLEIERVSKSPQSDFFPKVSHPYIVWQQNCEPGKIYLAKIKECTC